MGGRNKPIIIHGDVLEEMHIDGIPRYVHEVIKHIDACDDASDLDIRICYPSDDKVSIGGLKRIKECPLNKNGKKFRLQVLRKYIKEQNGISCTFANDIQFYRNGICTIHDVRPLDAEIYDSTNVKRAFLLLKYSVKLMNSTIVTVSEFSKERICRVLKVPKNKVYVIPNGWEHIARIEEDSSIFDRIHNIQKGNYFYSIGSVAKHKNFKWIYEVAKRNPKEKFVIAGNIDREFWGTDDSEMKVDNLIFCGYVSDEENVALMKNCKAFLFPSKYEGFGIPPLEALALGKKIIISNATCLPEIFGNSAVYFNPDNYDVDLESMMRQEVYDGEKVLNKYTWENSAKLWINLFREKQG